MTEGLPWGLREAIRYNRSVKEDRYDSVKDRVLNNSRGLSVKVVVVRRIPRSTRLK
jgi:hypothetical protein